MSKERPPSDLHLGQDILVRQYGVMPDFERRERDFRISGLPLIRERGLKNYLLLHIITRRIIEISGSL